ncbi:quinone-dependent dihydroorotate dehydrogenase [Wenzhouxiangella limi]|uniref:Dihydroorotate dehydrogenase (quinone) n=1 Tax=Wenzhouxiangella limi TaxID=2707351 RepID=A0A845V2F8_9GAMM|nr:quinone-dependent dihydroorotate dehydrogenase [Wenzhouxiangella limi]NDY94461.1 quinone-dependent dihydroorotate dehydrogenase [Wenzhouxiangella limi]
MYRWLRKGMFLLSPETAHEVAVRAMAAGQLTGMSRVFAGPRPEHPVELMGLSFPNPVGLAAGFDKNGDFIDALGALGFGHIEVGTVTPKPQPGNPRPRLFRLPEHEAIINRMGFNNKGVDHLAQRLRQVRYDGVVGANIGRQKDTPTDQAAGDYRICLEKLYGECDYIAVNISSPNTPNLRELQDTGPLKELLEELVQARTALQAKSETYRPIVVKIAPDWNQKALDAALEVIGHSGLDGLIATNTTLGRATVEDHPNAEQTGGLSGRPLMASSTEVLARARVVLGPDFPILASGGIHSGDDAREKHAAGADLVQLYTGFIYEGPGLIRACTHAWGKSAPHAAA